jgi:hypothetical protein
MEPRNHRQHRHVTTTTRNATTSHNATTPPRHHHYLERKTLQRHHPQPPTTYQTTTSRTTTQHPPPCLRATARRVVRGVLMALSPYHAGECRPGEGRSEERTTTQWHPLPTTHHLQNPAPAPTAASHCSQGGSRVLLATSPRNEWGTTHDNE